MALNSYRGDLAAVAGGVIILALLALNREAFEGDECPVTLRPARSGVAATPCGQVVKYVGDDAVFVGVAGLSAIVALKTCGGCRGQSQPSARSRWTVASSATSRAGADSGASVETTLSRPPQDAQTESL
jgi:hypothetical protein